MQTVEWFAKQCFVISLFCGSSIIVCKYYETCEMDVQMIQAESQLEIRKSEMHTLQRWISRLNDMKERESKKWLPNAEAEFREIIAMMEDRYMSLSFELSTKLKRISLINNDQNVKTVLRQIYESIFETLKKLKRSLLINNDQIVRTVLRLN